MNQKKIKQKTEEEIKEEAKKEFEKENEIKEQTRKELEEEKKIAELKEYKSTARKRSVGKIISRIIWTVVILFVLFETVIGILDMTRLNEDKEPVWYFSTKTEKTKEGTEITYDLGLYVIKKVKSSSGSKLVLKPFFLK